MNRHRLAGVAGAAGLLLPLSLLVSCGTDAAPTASAPAAVNADAKVVPAAAREADGEAFVTKLRTAVEQIDTTRFEVELTGQLEASATGAADLTTTPPTVQLTPDTPLMGVGELRLVDGVGYAQIGDQWVKADLDALLRMLPVDVADLDLDSLADALGASLTDVEVTGDTGEEAWSATVDPTALVSELGLSGGLGETSGKATEARVTATFTGDRLDAVVLDAGDRGSVEITLSDQGDPVDVTAPQGAVDFGDFGWSAHAPEQPGG